MPILCEDLLGSQCISVMLHSNLFLFLPVFLAPQNLYSYEIDFHTGVCEISEYGTPLSTWVFNNNNFFCFFVVFL